MADIARFGYRHHLVRLVARSEAAAARLAVAGSPEARAALAGQSRRAAARLSARLDASPLTDETSDEVDERGSLSSTARRQGPEPGPAAGADAPAGWAAALKLEGAAPQEVAAIEYANSLACHDLEREVAGELFAAPLSALVSLHERLVDGLVAPERIGRVRTVDHDIHDGAQGQVIFRTPPTAELPALLDELVGWIGEGSARLPALVVAGVVHARLLQWQPFDAANGRLARSAARVVLRARGLDPAGLAVPERALAADSLGYHREVAASIRRRGDLTGWLERMGEAVAEALEDAADALTGGPAEPPERAREVAASLAPGKTITLPEYAGRVGVDRDTAAGDLEALRRARWVSEEPGTQGLRLRRR